MIIIQVFESDSAIKELSDQLEASEAKAAEFEALKARNINYTSDIYISAIY